MIARDFVQLALEAGVVALQLLDLHLLGALALEPVPDRGLLQLRLNRTEHLIAQTPGRKVPRAGASR